MSNTEVKPFKVDGTMAAKLWESRTLPVNFNPAIVCSFAGFFFVEILFLNI